MKPLLTLLVFCVLTSFSFPPNGKKPNLTKSYKYIPSGVLKMPDGNEVSIQGFFLFETEITNLDYREFLYYLEHNGRTADLEVARIRNEAWESAMTFSEPLAAHYHTHPAYEGYPVVNVSHEAAELYCRWLTQILQDQNPGWIVQVRLPTEAEWMYAASGGRTPTPYPFGPYLRNTKGELLYNFKRIGDESIHQSNGALEIMDVPEKQVAYPQTLGPAPARSNQPNEFGLYNTCGNVAERLAEPGRTKGGSFNSTGYDIRIDAPDVYAGATGPSPFIGFRPLVTVLKRED